MNDRSGDALAQRRRHRDHRRRRSRARSSGSSGGVVARVERRAELLVADVLDVGTAGAQRVDPVGRDVVADDAEAHLGGPHRQREPDVALADDHDLGGALLDRARSPAASSDPSIRETISRSQCRATGAKRRNGGIRRRRCHSTRPDGRPRSAVERPPVLIRLSGLNPVSYRAVHRSGRALGVSRWT